jgi:hypothetical protein
VLWNQSRLLKGLHHKRASQLLVSYGDSWVRLEGEGRFERRMVALHHASAELVANLVANLVREPGEDWSSRKRTTPGLVASAKPEFAVISVGSGSSFGLASDRRAEPSCLSI